MGARREDPRHLRGHPADPAAHRRAARAGQDLRRSALTARYVPRRLLPGLAFAATLLLLGVAAALLGVEMGWLLAAFMAWIAVGTVRRLLRRDPVLTIDTSGVTDHRIPATIAWADVERMRTLDRRVLVQKVPMLELVPHRPLTRDTWSVLRAVLRGDLAVVDARDASRLVIDLQHLDATPEQILDAARTARG